MRMLTKSNVSVAVENLSKRGFLTCSADGQDRRIVRLRFTPEAEPLQKDVRLVQKEFSCAVLDGIPQDEIETFLDTLSKIKQNAENKMKEIQA